MPVRLTSPAELVWLLLHATRSRWTPRQIRAYLKRLDRQPTPDLNTLLREAQDRRWVHRDRRGFYYLHRAYSLTGRRVYDSWSRAYLEPPQDWEYCGNLPLFPLAPAHPLYPSQIDGRPHRWPGVIGRRTRHRLRTYAVLPEMPGPLPPRRLVWGMAASAVPEGHLLFIEAIPPFELHEFDHLPGPSTPQPAWALWDVDADGGITEPKLFPRHGSLLDSPEFAWLSGALEYLMTAYPPSIRNEPATGPAPSSATPVSAMAVPHRGYGLSPWAISPPQPEHPSTWGIHIWFDTAARPEPSILTLLPRILDQTRIDHWPGLSFRIRIETAGPRLVDIRRNPVQITEWLTETELVNRLTRGIDESGVTWRSTVHPHLGLRYDAACQSLTRWHLAVSHLFRLVDAAILAFLKDRHPTSIPLRQVPLRWIPDVWADVLPHLNLRGLIQDLPPVPGDLAWLQDRLPPEQHRGFVQFLLFHIRTVFARSEVSDGLHGCVWNPRFHPLDFDFAQWLFDFFHRSKQPFACPDPTVIRDLDSLWWLAWAPVTSRRMASCEWGATETGTVVATSPWGLGLLLEPDGRRVWVPAKSLRPLGYFYRARGACWVHRKKKTVLAWGQSVPVYLEPTHPWWPFLACPARLDTHQASREGRR